jgi:hypothetical protein
MKLPSIEFMMIAVRGISLLLALLTLGWAFARWRRENNRDAQRMFEQLDLVRAELLQLQGQVASSPSQSSQRNSHADAYQQSYGSTQPSPRPSVANYPDFDTERAVMTESRRSNAPITKPKSLTNAAPRGYEVAARLARNGASSEELMNTCALSRHEAELLVRLNSGMKSSQPPAPASAKQAATNGGTNSTTKAQANVNHLKDIGSRYDKPVKPAASLVNRPAASRPATGQRVSLVG